MKIREKYLKVYFETVFFLVAILLFSKYQKEEIPLSAPAEDSSQTPEVEIISFQELKRLLRTILITKTNPAIRFC